MLVWSALRQVWASPGAVGRLLRPTAVAARARCPLGRHHRHRRRRRHAWPSAMPARPARRCRTSRSRICCARRRRNSPATGATARRIFEAMLASPDTEQLGLRGLFLEAEREGDGRRRASSPSARSSSTRKLAWPVEALFDLQCRAEDWQGALDTLAIAQRSNLIDKAVAQPPPRRAADRAGAGGGGYGRRTRPSSWHWRRTGWRRTWCRPRRSPAACWPRRATRRAPRACCSRPGAFPRIPISPRPMPTPGPATARATGSTACATSARLTPARQRGRRSRSPSPPSRRASGTRRARR